MVRLDRKYRVVVAALLVGGCASRPEAPSLVELHMQARGGSARVHAIGAIEDRSRTPRIGIRNAGLVLDGLAAELRVYVAELTYEELP